MKTYTIRIWKYKEIIFEVTSQFESPTHADLYMDGVAVGLKAAGMEATGKYCWEFKKA